MLMETKATPESCHRTIAPVSSCCGGASGTEDGAEESGSKKSGKCAVCAIVALYSPADAAIVYKPLIELIELRHDLLAGQVASVNYHLPYWSTAPPRA